MGLLNYWGLGLGRLPGEATSEMAVEADAGAPNGWAIGCSSSGAVGQIALPPMSSSSDTIFASGYMKVLDPTGTNVDGIFYLRRAGTSDYLRFDLKSSGVIEVGADSSNNGNLTLTFGQFAPTYGEWFHFAIEWLSHNSTGVLRVRINGVAPFADITSGDTQAGSGTVAQINMSFRNAFGHYGRFHSLVVNDSSGSSFNAIQPVQIVDATTVDGVGTSDWTGSDADSVDNHQLVDEAPAAAADTTDYIESSTTGHRQLFDIAPQGINGEPKAVKVSLFGRDTDAGGQVVDVGLRSSGSETVNAIPFPAADEEMGSIIELDPNGSAAWTQANRDAAQVVLEVA